LSDTVRIEAEYCGEFGGEPYTVQVLPSDALEPLKGQHRVVLRIRFRELTRAVMATVGSRRGEAHIHAAVRRRIDAGWPD
jgi:hypothetical protein